MKKTLRLRPYRASDSDYYDFCGFYVSVSRSCIGGSASYCFIGEFMGLNFDIHRVPLDVFTDVDNALDVLDFFSDLLRLANDDGFTPKSAVESLADKYDDMDLYDVCSSYGYDLMEANINVDDVKASARKRFSECLQVYGFSRGGSFSNGDAHE